MPKLTVAHNTARVDSPTNNRGYGLTTKLSRTKAPMVPSKAPSQISLEGIEDMVSKLSSAELQGIVKRFPFAAAVFEALADARLRDTSKTDVYRFKLDQYQKFGRRFDFDELIMLFEILQRAGFGELKYPPNTKRKATFFWNTSMLSVASTALGRPPVHAEPVEAPSAHAAPPAPAPRADAFVVNVVAREDLNDSQKISMIKLYLGV
jgi:hypothetical protein